MTINKENHLSGVVLLSPGAILQSRYRIVRQLGRGGMGAVYEAIDLRLGHTVALKQTLTQSSDVWKQFEREARLMAQLNHPALPRVSDYFTESNRAFFVMQHVEGPDLADIIAQQPGPMPQQTVVAWADQLLDALIYLHSHDRQIIHRDIKPHNLKLTATGKIALLDFGLAKSQSGDGAEDGRCRSIFGYSPRYAPLEQIQDLGTSPESDIYALGATLYHLLTGFKPVDAITRASALIGLRPNPLKPAHEINSAVSPELSAILSRAMEQNPRDRYHSATEFREALRRIGRLEDEHRQCTGRHHVVETNTAVVETTILKPPRNNAFSRFRSHAVTLILLILLAGFGVFCRYYSWKLPQQARDRSHVGSLAVSSAIEGDRSRSQGRKDRSLSRQ